MIIKKLTASFGTLAGKSLELGEGLNIIQAGNEAGKSTWCAFLRVMLYGLKTRDREKAGYLPDKSRYMPWSGKAMEGQVELSARGRDVTISRSQRGVVPMGAFSAVYSQTGENVPWIPADGAGETLTGVPEKVFERSAFIRQAGLGVDHSSELEARISSLVSSGEEGVSYAEAETRLHDWRKKRFVNRSTGRIPQIERSLGELDEKLSRIAAANERTVEAKQTLKELKAEQERLAREKTFHEAVEQDQHRRELGEQELRLKRLSGRVEELEERLRRDGRVLEKADAQSVRTDCAAYQQLRVELAGAKNRAAQLERELEEKKSGLDKTSFAGMSAEAARDEAARRFRTYEGANDVRAYDPKKFTLGYILLGLLFIVCAGVAVLMNGVMPWYPIGFAVGLASLAALLILFLSGRDRKRKRAAAEETMAGILRAAGASGPGELKAQAEDYAARLEEYENTRAEAEKAAGELETLTETAKNLTARLGAELKLFGAEGMDIREALEQVDKWEEVMDELAALRMSRQSEKKLLDQLESLRAAEKTQTPEPEGEKPRFSRSETEEYLSRRSAQVAELEKKIAAAEGEARALGDPVVIGAEAARLKNELARQNEQYEALNIALEELEGANTEIRTRFSPLLSRRAGEIVESLTGGRYKGLYFDREWNAKARLSEDAAAHDALYLSAGAGDQLYLALRLAICELILSGAEACPIVLDDALTNFDDARMKNALDWLEKEAETRQVLLFTCHSREAEYLRGREKVNIISL